MPVLCLFDALDGAGQVRAAALDPHAQVTAREGHDDLTLAVSRGGDCDRAVPEDCVSPTPRSQTLAVTRPGPSTRAT